MLLKIQIILAFGQCILSIPGQMVSFAPSCHQYCHILAASFDGHASSTPLRMLLQSGQLQVTEICCSQHAPPCIPGMILFRMLKTILDLSFALYCILGHALLPSSTHSGLASFCGRGVPFEMLLAIAGRQFRANPLSILGLGQGHLALRRQQASFSVCSLERGGTHLSASQQLKRGP